MAKLKKEGGKWRHVEADEKIVRTLTIKDLTAMKAHLRKAFALIWSLHLLAWKDVLGDLGENEADIMLSEASWELEQADNLLNEGPEKKAA